MSSAVSDLYLQWDSQADLLGVVTEDAPRSIEEDKTDPLLRLDNLPLQDRGTERQRDLFISTLFRANGTNNFSHVCTSKRE